jgi:hypothetical protein
MAFPRHDLRMVGDSRETAVGMVRTSVSIPEFLRRAMVACERSSDAIGGFAGMVVIAARAADTGVHDRLLDDWDSLDDVTHDRLLVLSPSSTREVHVEFPNGYGRRLATQGLQLRGDLSTGWAHEFWGLPPDTSGDDLDAYMESLPQLDDRRRISSAFTRSATDVARFFGISQHSIAGQAHYR